MKFNTSLFTTKNLNRAAILIAMSVVLKSYLSITMSDIRITLYGIPLMILGMLMGPLAALVAGLAVDWLYVITSPFAFSFNLMTVSAMMWGLIPALVFYKKSIRLNYFNVAIVVIITSLIAFTLNTLQLYQWFNVGIYEKLPVRFIIMIAKWPIQIYAVKHLYQLVNNYLDQNSYEGY